MSFAVASVISKNRVFQKIYIQNIRDDEDGCDFVCHICYKIEDDDNDVDEECDNNYYDDDINLYNMYKKIAD